MTAVFLTAFALALFVVFDIERPISCRSIHTRNFGFYVGYDIASDNPWCLHVGIGEQRPLIEGMLRYRFGFSIVFPRAPRWAELNPCHDTWQFDSANWTGRQTYAVTVYPMWWRWRPNFWISCS